MATPGRDRGGKDRATRDARERARVYQARQDFHAGRGRRRARDNVIAGAVGGVLLLAAIGVQTAYFVAGPGAPATPSSTVTPDPVPPSSEDPAPEQTEEPAPEQTEDPEATPSPTP